MNEKQQWMTVEGDERGEGKTTRSKSKSYSCVVSPLVAFGFFIGLTTSRTNLCFAFFFTIGCFGGFCNGGRPPEKTVSQVNEKNRTENIKPGNQTLII